MNDTTPAALRPVVVLLLVDLALSALLAAAFVVFRASLTDHALAPTRLPPGSDLDAALAGVGAGLWWVDVEQGVQAAVVLGLLWAAARPAVRTRFAKVR